MTYSFSTATLSQLCTLVTDGTHDTPKVVQAGAPMIKGKDISKGYIDFTSCDHISQEDHQHIIKRSKAERGDTLFANIGNSLGDVAFVDTERPFSIKNVALFKPDPQVVDCRYLFHLLRSPQVQGALLAQRAGAAQPFLGLAALRAFAVAYHSDLELQRRIAGILGAYDDLIEVNRRRVAVLEDMARGLFEEWFVRLRFPAYELVPVHDAALGLLPEGWRWGTFSELVSEVRLSVQPADIEPEAAYIGLEHLPRRSTTLADRGRPSDVSSTKLRFKRGDILFGKIRPYFHKVVWAPYDGVCSTDAIVWRPVAQLQAQALAIASSDAFVNQSVQTSNGTKMPRANPKVLANFACRIAPADISARFESLCHPLAEAAAQYQAANERLSASRDLLLPRLMSGQLSVVEAEAEAQKELEIA